MRGNSHVRCEVGENLEITSKDYLSLYYKPLPMMTAYKEMGWDIKDFPNSYDYYANLITLPLHTKLNDEDVDYIIKNFRDVVKEYI